MLVTVGGAVARPSVLEVPIGAHPSAAFIHAGAGAIEVTIVGGYHGTWITPSPDFRISRRAAAGNGATLGAGVILVLDLAICALGELTRVASWLANESSRQRGPCRFGLPALVADLNALMAGDPSAGHAMARHVGLVTGRGSCAHPDGAARFITSAIAALSDEILTHRRHRGCGRSVLGQLPITRPGRR